RRPYKGVCRGPPAPARDARGAGGSVDEPAFDRPAAQLVPVRELELAQHRADVRLDGLMGDPEAQRDLLVLVAARDQPQHLALAKRQPIELRVHLRLFQLALEGVEDEAREPGREDRVAVADPADRVRELLAG